MIFRGGDGLYIVPPCSTYFWQMIYGWYMYTVYRWIIDYIIIGLMVWISSPSHSLRFPSKSAPKMTLKTQISFWDSVPPAWNLPLDVFVLCINVQWQSRIGFCIKQGRLLSLTCGSKEAKVLVKEIHTSTSHQQCGRLGQVAKSWCKIFLGSYIDK